MSDDKKQENSGQAEASKTDVPAKITYKRPSGSTIEVADNEANRAKAAELGWEETKPSK